MPKTTLKGLLPQELRKDLTPAEEILLDKAQQGERADFTTGDEETDKPENADTWGDDRRIRADLLYWLCVDREASELVHAKGIRIDGAKVEGQLDFEAATLPHPLLLVGCAIPEGIFLRDAQTRTIALSRSHTGPISADRLTTKGSMFLRERFQAKGEVCLLGANIGGDLDCSDATFDNPKGEENPKGIALNADRLTTQGYVFLRNAKVRGRVWLLGANIGGNLECDGATFENPGGEALVADGLTTHGGVFLHNGFQAKGEVRLSGANIGAHLDCSDATFDNPKGEALSAETLLVKGGLFWRSMEKRPVGVIDLRHAKVGQLVDDAASWPLADSVWLDGFEYEAFGIDSPRTAKERLDWLALQPEKPFHPQPYEQLAKVFRQMGREVEARKVLIAKQDARRKHGELSRTSNVWLWFLGKTIRYGYEPWRVMWFMVVMILIGWGVFWGADTLTVMELTKKEGAPVPAFNPFIYSLEVFVPLVDLHQERYYLPNTEGTCGAWSCVAWFRAYFWLHIILGWVSSTLLVAALTGLVRKE